MKIKVVASIGHGQTTLSAFDNALKNAGIMNYNLLVLSSVIPPHSEVITNGAFASPADEWGHKLYVVKADMRSRESGKYIGSALGWYQLEDGRGVFVEHETDDKTYKAAESNLEASVTQSLKDLCKFRDIPFDEKKVNIRMSIAHVTTEPTCALVLAVYQSEGWR
jgi:arginine decarboxylase